MKRRFKAKRRRNFGLIKWILLLLLVLFINNKITKLYPIEKIVEKKEIKLEINPDRILLSRGLNYKLIEENKEIIKPAFKEVTTTKTTTTKKIIRPVIYIYSTHQTEEYKDYDVYKASSTLKTELEKKDVEVILETTNIKKELTKKNLAYKDSYKITRELLKKHLSNKISLYIDLHRDSVNHKTTTTEYNHENVAKVMFVVGGKHLSYKDNYKVADNLNKMLKNINPQLSRGIFVRENSSFNQDLNSKVILIELGGVDNTREEIDNAIKYLSNILSNYVKE